MEGCGEAREWIVKKEVLKLVNSKRDKGAVLKNNESGCKWEQTVVLYRSG